jgi:hypothetical protein
MILTNAIVSGNHAGGVSGGGIYIYNSSPILTNVIVSGNHAGLYGGGISTSNSTVLTNVTVSGNYAGNGGGIYNTGSSIIRNSIIWGNTGGTPGIYNSGWTAFNSDVQASSFTTTANANGNINDDPLFVTTIIPIPPDTTADYRLQAASGPACNTGDGNLYPDTWAKWSTDPAIDASFKTAAFQILYNTYIGPALTTDLAGSSRYNGTIDMGAYEF